MSLKFSFLFLFLICSLSLFSRNVDELVRDPEGFYR